MVTDNFQRLFYRVLSIPVSVLAVALVVFLDTPNPMMVLIIPVVLFSYADGFIGGALSGFVSIMYSFYFFSNPDTPFTYDEVNVQKVMTIVAAVSVTVFLVGRLKERDLAYLRDKDVHVRDMARINDELEAALIDARNANKAKSHFLSVVSHDIRTPMNVILGMANMAMDQRNNPEAVADYLNKISSSGSFMLCLINDVLDMSKIESGEMEIFPESYRLTDFETDVRTLFGPQCEEKGITLSIDISEAPDTALSVDKTRFKQIFFNLISNAIKFTHEGGGISFAAKCVPIDGEGGLLRCEFVVSDNGIGMSRKFQENMFVPFAQERNVYSARYKGTGLGLPIVKNIVETVGGTIEVESEEGVGTTFTIRVDLLPGEDVPSEAPAEPVDWCSLRGRKVLVAEDHPLNTEIIEHLLSREEMIVTCAEDGRQAVEIFDKSPEGYFDAILMDIHMPKMNGLEATTHIRALDRPDAASVPIIAMTADAFDEDVRKSHESGMNGHITKPIDPALLYGTLASLTAAKKEVILAVGSF